MSNVQSITVSLEWAKIPEYEMYEVSNHGNVRRSYSARRWYKPGRYKMLSPASTRGYRHVTLSKKDKKKNYRIARLVAETFIPNPKAKSQVNHKDGNPSNDIVENLEWCTPSENTCHAIRLGLRTTSPTAA